MIITSSLSGCGSSGTHSFSLVVQYLPFFISITLNLPTTWWKTVFLVDDALEFHAPQSSSKILFSPHNLFLTLLFSIKIYTSSLIPFGIDEFATDPFCNSSHNDSASRKRPFSWLFWIEERLRLLIGGWRWCWSCSPGEEAGKGDAEEYCPSSTRGYWTELYKKMTYLSVT